MTTMTYSPTVSTPSRSRAATVTGWVLTGLVVAFLTFDLVIKLGQMSVAIEGSAVLGFEANDVFRLGLIELACLTLYLVPRTAILGAVLWTGYLGGAIAIHMQLGNPLFSHVLFPIYVGLFLWGGLWLRDTRLQTLFPVRRG